ncbi:aminotransferase class IV [Paenibacillus algorifonticola]|uniref:aminotransferase class IV n=1 Tax=Paenibacillus algorifonticola TaxID=684063 RepID=UPI003D27C535
MKVAFNGDVMDAGQAVISIYDHGFLYGLGLFETFRTYGGRAYLLERHLRRLEAGCASLGIRYKTDQSTLEASIAELLHANELKDGYVRLTVTAGDGGLGLPMGDYEQPQELILMKPLPPYQAALYEHGRELRLLHTKRNTPEGEIRLKSLHYMNNIIAKRELAASNASPGAEGLMLSGAGLLTEGIVSNLFFTQDGVIRTPAVDTGILPGITRERVMELARAAGFQVEEGHYSWNQLLGADEIWLTGSVQELVPVTRLSGTDGTLVKVGKEAGAGSGVGYGKARNGAMLEPEAEAGKAGTVAGPITRQLLKAYRSDTMRSK